MHPRYSSLGLRFTLGQITRHLFDFITLLMGLNQSSFMFTMCFRKSFELIKSADEIGGIFLYEFKDVSEKVKDLSKRLCLPDLSKDNSSCCKKKPLSKLFSLRNCFLFDSIDKHWKVPQKTTKKQERLKCQIIYMNSNKSSKRNWWGRSLL